MQGLSKVQVSSMLEMGAWQKVLVVCAKIDNKFNYLLPIMPGASSPQNTAFIPNPIQLLRRIAPMVFWLKYALTVEPSPAAPALPLCRV